MQVRRKKSSNTTGLRRQTVFARSPKNVQPDGSTLEKPFPEHCKIHLAAGGPPKGLQGEKSYNPTGLRRTKLQPDGATKADGPKSYKSYNPTGLRRIKLQPDGATKADCPKIDSGGSQKCGANSLLGTPRGLKTDAATAVKP